MIKSLCKVIDHDLTKFFDSLYNSYGPGFFLLLSGVFLLVGLTPKEAGLNGSMFPAWLWWILSGAYLIMYMDMKRQEKGKHSIFYRFKNLSIRKGGKS